MTDDKIVWAIIIGVSVAAWCFFRFLDWLDERADEREMARLGIPVDHPYRRALLREAQRRDFDRRHAEREHAVREFFRDRV